MRRGVSRSDSRRLDSGHRAGAEADRAGPFPPPGRPAYPDLRSHPFRIPRWTRESPASRVTHQEDRSPAQSRRPASFVTPPTCSLAQTAGSQELGAGPEIRAGGPGDARSPAPTAALASTTSNHGAPMDCGQLSGVVRTRRGASARRNEGDGRSREQLPIVGRGGRRHGDNCELHFGLDGNGARSSHRPDCRFGRTRSSAVDPRLLRFFRRGDLHRRGLGHPREVARRNGP